jgi:hypothetical protein
MSGGWHIKERYEWMGTPLKHRNPLAHSFGCSPVAYAAKYGCRFNTVVLVGAPERHDLPWKELIANSERLLIIHQEGFDKLQILGTMFDGGTTAASEVLRGPHGHKINTWATPGIDHSKVLHDPGYIHYWKLNTWGNWFFLPPERNL